MAGHPKHFCLEQLRRKMMQIQITYFFYKLTKESHCVKSIAFEIFLVSIFPYLDWIRRDTPDLSVYSPNVGKYGPEKLRLRTFFTQWVVWHLQNSLFTTRANVFKQIIKIVEAKIHRSSEKDCIGLHYLFNFLIFRPCTHC